MCRGENAFFTAAREKRRLIKALAVYCRGKIPAAFKVAHCHGRQKPWREFDKGLSQGLAGRRTKSNWPYQSSKSAQIKEV